MRGFVTPRDCTTLAFKYNFSNPVTDGDKVLDVRIHLTTKFVAIDRIMNTEHFVWTIRKFLLGLLKSSNGKCDYRPLDDI